VTRGAPRTGASTVELVPTKATSRAAAEAAIRKHELNEAIKAAHDEGAIDRKEMIRLMAKLRQGRVTDVAAAIPTGFTGEKALRETSLEQRTAERQAAREKFQQLMAELDEEQQNEEGAPEELSVDRTACCGRRSSRARSTRRTRFTCSRCSRARPLSKWPTC
jgi:hypothetical protein